ncbi:SDR family oxidoreductase [Streptomyces sp. NPDC021093]|uniref:SDR family oxidoreductase n=1 Tax=Streptomyces sp. NPDC021093 TaxID=3365112 RepID=UPI0037A77C14
MSTSAGPRAVLLTGVTGSLGGHLCAELLARTRATVYCLARGDAHRVDHRLAELGIAPGERVVHVSGDVARPRLGLSPASYDALAETVDEILHCAAHVNLAAGYDRLAPVNVGGTRHVIALAERADRLTRRPVPLRYVSTLGTLAAARDVGLTEVDELTPATARTAGPLGYPLTKATAERELLAAADRGLPLTVFRPGVVTGDTRTGRTSASDLLVPVLRASAVLGRVPAGVGAIPVDAIDVVARALVELSRQPEAAGRTYHLIHPRPLPLAEVFAAMRRAGHLLEVVEGEEWWSAVDDHAADRAVLPQAAMREVGQYAMITGPDYRVPVIRSDRTWQALDRAGVQRPPLDGPFLDRIVRGLTAEGLLRPRRT